MLLLSTRRGPILRKMVAWRLVKLVSKIHGRFVHHLTRPVGTSLKIGFQVKRILVAQRENSIVNRLNKTKEEKYPDLQMEKEEILKALRKKDQASRLERVSRLLLRYEETA